MPSKRANDLTREISFDRHDLFTSVNGYEFRKGGRKR